MYPLYLSEYKRRWKGILLKKTPHQYKNKTYYIGLFLIVSDSSGNSPKRRMLKSMGLGWMKYMGKYDSSNLNQDWLKLPE